MNKPEDRPDPRELLEAFVASGRGETVFAELVKSISGLIYTSALRRTNDSQLAEEVMQNVFAIMARKAESLIKHPSLIAWALETARLQSAVVIRSEKRRQRKLAALANEAKAQDPVNAQRVENEAKWTDAIPILDNVLARLPLKDRDVVLKRFYEGKKFREIADENGQTEAACKMRLKRALSKISAGLTSRGVTLSATALASALGTEFARSAPADAVAVATPKALAASSSISGTSILINTVQTMSTAKTIVATAATVIVISTIPFAQQRAEAKRLQSELIGVAAPPDVPKRLTAIQKRETPPSSSALARQAFAARNLLASLDEPMEHREFLTSLFRMMDGGDPVRKSLALARVSQMSVAEYGELLGALRAYPCSKFSKDWLKRELDDYAPEMTRRERVEILIADGSIGFEFYPMREWAKEDPDDALAWYREKVASGDIFGKGLDPKVQRTIFMDLLRGIAPQNPDLALKMYASTPPEDFDGNTVLFLTRGLAESMMATGDESHILEMLDLHGGKHRDRIVRSTAESLADAGRFDEGMEFRARFDTEPNSRIDQMERMFRALDFRNVIDGLEWAVTTTPQEDVPETFRRLGSSVTSRPVDFDSWLKGQAPGEVRDYSYAGMVDERVRRKDFETALPAAQNIGDPGLRVATLEKLASDWLAHDESAATEALPTDLIERLQN